MEALIIIYLFLPLIFTTYKQNLKSFYFFFLAVMVFTFGDTFLVNITTLVSSLTHQLSITKFALNYLDDINVFRDIYGYAIGYFMLGGIMHQHRESFHNPKCRKWAQLAIPFSMLLLFAFGVAESKRKGEVWDIVWFGYDTVFTLVNVAAIYILSLYYQHQGILGKSIKIVGENSLGIYLTHVIIGNLLFPYFLKYEVSSTVPANLIFALAIIGCSVVTALALKRIPVLKELLKV